MTIVLKTINPKIDIEIFPGDMKTSSIITAKNAAFTFLEEDESINEKIIAGVLEATKKGFASIRNYPTYYLNISNIDRTLDYILTSDEYATALVRSQRYVKNRRFFLPKEIIEDRRNSVYSLIKKQNLLYGELLKIPHKRSKEIARRILPFASESKIYLKANPEIIANYVKIREFNDNGLTDSFNTFIDKVQETLNQENIFLASLSSSVFFKNYYRIPFRKALSLEDILESYNIKKETIFRDGVYVRILNEPEGFSKALYELVSLSKRYLSIITNTDMNKEEELKVYRKAELEFNMLSFHPAITGFKILVASSIPVVVYNELKRHRQISMYVEPIYDAVERLKNIFDRYTIRELVNVINRTSKEGRYILSVIDIPNIIRKRKDLMIRYLEITKEAIELYSDLSDRGISPSKAIYILPQNIKVGVLFELNGRDILNIYGFYKIRSCVAAEIGMLEFIYKFREGLINETKNKEYYKELVYFLHPKCEFRCLEPYKRRKQFGCNIVLKRNTKYTLDHQKYLEK